MDNLPDPQTITTSNDGLRVLLGVAAGAIEDNGALDLTAVKILLQELRKRMQRSVERMPRSPQTRYLALLCTAIEEGEGWLHKAEMEA